MWPPSDRKVTNSMNVFVSAVIFLWMRLGLCLPLFSLDPLFVCNRDEGEERTRGSQIENTDGKKPVQHNPIIGHILLDFCVRLGELNLTIDLFLRIM